MSHKPVSSFTCHCWHGLVSLTFTNALKSWFWCNSMDFYHKMFTKITKISLTHLDWHNSRQFNTLNTKIIPFLHVNFQCICYQTIMSISNHLIEIKQIIWTKIQYLQFDVQNVYQILTTILDSVTPYGAWSNCSKLSIFTSIEKELRFLPYTAYCY